MPIFRTTFSYAAYRASGCGLGCRLRGGCSCLQQRTPGRHVHQAVGGEPVRGLELPHHRGGLRSEAAVRAGADRSLHCRDGRAGGPGAQRHPGVRHERPVQRRSAARRVDPRIGRAPNGIRPRVGGCPVQVSHPARAEVLSRHGLGPPGRPAHRALPGQGEVHVVAVARRVAGRGGVGGAGRVGLPAGCGVVGAPDPVVPDDVHDPEAARVGRDVPPGVLGGQPAHQRVAPGLARGRADVGEPVDGAAVVVLAGRQRVRAAAARDPVRRAGVRRLEQLAQRDGARLVPGVTGRGGHVGGKGLDGGRQPTGAAGATVAGATVAAAVAAAGVAEASGAWPSDVASTATTLAPVRAMRAGRDTVAR